jgi:glycosyltransferase involved in cell wall biosynthesis
MRLAIALAARQSGLYQTIIALTKRELVLLQELTKHRRILVIPSGIDSTVFMRGHVFYKRDRDMILFVGRLAGNKGLSSLIQAIGIVAAKIPTVRLVVVGKDCGELVSAKRLAIKLGNRVEFLGEVPDDMLDKLIRTACLMVLPSKYESFGLVVLESLARGTPVLVSNGVALADEVTDAGCGLTFPYGDIAEMAECIGRIMSCDEEWHRLSQQGLRFVKGYSWDNIVAKMLDVYAEAMG